MPHTTQLGNLYQPESFITLEHAEILTGTFEMKDGLSGTKLSIKPDGTALSASPNDGGALIDGFDSVNALQRHIEVDASGRIIIVAPAAGLSTTILGQTQVHTTETTAALGAGVAFTSTSRDQNTFEALGVSVFVTAGAGSLNVRVDIENSLDNVTFRNVDSVTLTGGVGASGSLNRVYATTRRYMRIVITNLDGANALTVTEGATIQKPIG